MTDLATIAQAVAVISACWAIVSGVGAWKREFIGKRKIELAEQILAKFFEVKDAIAFIRNPWSSSDEGKSRKRAEAEPEEDAALLDRAYIVVERYEKKQSVFTEFNTLKYRCMAAFGSGTGQVFLDTNKVLQSIFVSARLLATVYWKNQGRVPMDQKQLNEIERHERVYSDMGEEDDEIKKQLEEIQTSLEAVTAPCFEEPMKLYSILTTQWKWKSASTTNKGMQPTP